eukprot:7360518-Pyramimonas_sp.AAC.1
MPGMGRRAVLVDCGDVSLMKYWLRTLSATGPGGWADALADPRKTFPAIAWEEKCTRAGAMKAVCTFLVAGLGGWAGTAPTDPTRTSPATAKRNSARRRIC